MRIKYSFCRPIQYRSYEGEDETKCHVDIGGIWNTGGGAELWWGFFIPKPSLVLFTFLGVKVIYSLCTVLGNQ